MRLEKPVNLRPRYICTCYTCRWGQFDGDGCYICVRDPENVYWDVGDGEHIEMVCDRYKGRK